MSDESQTTVSDEEIARTDPDLCEHGWSALHPQPCPECEGCVLERTPDEEAEFNLAVQAAGGWQPYCLELAKADAREAMAAINAGDWLRADILLKLAVDYIADSGVLP